MAEVLLLNPKRRRRRKSKSSHRRRVRHVARAANPKRRRRRRNPFLINPRRRLRRRNPSVRHHRRRRRNPSLRGITSSLMPTVKSGFMGALGGLGLDIVMGQAAKYLPAQVASGYPLAAVKLLAAVLVGYVGNKLPGGRGHGRDLAVGGATIAIHDIIKPLFASAVPSVPLAGYFNAGTFAGNSPVGTPLLTTGMGAYQGRMGRLGAYLPMGDLSSQVNEAGEYNTGIY